MYIKKGEEHDITYCIHISPKDHTYPMIHTHAGVLSMSK